MHAHAVSLPNVGAVTAASANRPGRIDRNPRTISAGSGKRFRNVKLTGNVSRVPSIVGPVHRRTRGPSPLNAELMDAQDADEQQRIAARRMELIQSSDKELTALCMVAGLAPDGGKGELVDRVLRHEVGNEAFILYNGGRTGFLGGAPAMPPKPAATAAATPAAPAATPTPPAAPAADAMPPKPPAAPTPPTPPPAPTPPPPVEAITSASDSAAPEESEASAQAAAELAEAEAKLEAFEAANAAMLDAEQVEAQAAERAAASAAALVQARADRELEKQQESVKISKMLEQAEAEKAAAAAQAAADVASAKANAAQAAADAEKAAAEGSAQAAAAQATADAADAKAANEQAARDRATAAAARAAAATAELERLSSEEEAVAAASRVTEAEAKMQAAEAVAAAVAAQEKAASAGAAADGFAPLSEEGFAVPEEAPDRAAPADVEAEQKAQADLAAAAAKVAAAQEARAKAIALADETKKQEEAERRAKEEAAAAVLKAKEDAEALEMAQIQQAQAQALAEIEARQQTDQAEAKAKAKADVTRAENAAAAAAERVLAAQAQAQADAAIAAAQADGAKADGVVPTAVQPSAVSEDPAPSSNLPAPPVDLFADATEEDVAARTKKLGANVTSLGCAFGVWAPHAEGMTLLIYGGAPDPLRGYDASNIPVPARYEMYRDHNDGSVWRQEVQQVGAGWRYAFEVTMSDGHTFTRRDPWARETDFESDVCFVVDPKAFQWSDFKAPDNDALIMYQCHVGTFTGVGDPELGTTPGTFVALTRKLDYIKELGFNCLQLLPHTEFGGAWGYNPRLMHAVHGPYGDSLEFAELVEAAHKRGIAVLVDVALHHGAANGNSLWEYDGWSDGNGGIYFERAGDTGWGQGFAFWKEEVQEYLSATMDTWLGEYNCDGVRIDSAHSMPPDFVRRVTNRARQFPNKFVVVEHSPEGGHVPGELGADACWLFSNCDNCAGMTNYWKGNMERLESVAKQPEGYNGNGSFVKFPMGSHDTIGKRPGHTHDLGHWASRFGGRGEWRARASMRLWWGVAAAGVGIPMLFMGTETHQDGHWHTTEDASMDWSLISRGGEKWAKEGMDCVAAANKMRTSHLSLTKGSTRVTYTDHENGLIVVQRHYEGPDGDGNQINERCIVVINDGDGQWDGDTGYYGVNIGQPWGESPGFEEIFNSQDEEFGGWPGSGNKERGVVMQDKESVPLAIPKFGVVVLKMVEGPKAPSRDPNSVLAELSAGAAASITALGVE